MPFSHPYYAGQAIWAYSLIVRLDKARSAIRNLYFVAETPVQKEALDKYNKLRETLDQFIEGTCYKTWEQEIANMDSNAIDGKLDMCILTWSENSNNELPQSMNHPLFTKKKSGLLESNFDSELHKVISEGTYWQKNHGSWYHLFVLQRQQASPKERISSCLKRECHVDCKRLQ
jgi:hypothetical protein